MLLSHECGIDSYLVPPGAGLTDFNRMLVQVKSKPLGPLLTLSKDLLGCF